MDRVNVANLLQRAAAAGLSVQADGDLLRVRGPKRCEPLALELLGNKAAVLAALRGGEVGGVQVCAGRATDAVGTPDGAALYEVPDGWTTKAWRERLRFLASRCEADHPDRACELLEWADGLEGVTT